MSVSNIRISYIICPGANDTSNILRHIHVVGLLHYLKYYLTLSFHPMRCWSRINLESNPVIISRWQESEHVYLRHLRVTKKVGSSLVFPRSLFLGFPSENIVKILVWIHLKKKKTLWFMLSASTVTDFIIYVVLYFYRSIWFFEKRPNIGTLCFLSEVTLSWVRLTCPLPTRLFMLS